MKLSLLDELGDGAFADVWKAIDELDREVAVKIIRPANLNVADALTHAKALARAAHSNVVSVLTIDKVFDPKSQLEVDCVVMELLKGVTLTSKLSKDKLSAEAAKSIGLGLLEGLSHIHKQGMAHGDLHSDNVMVVDDTTKVIDILYLNSLASISTVHKNDRIRRDLFAIRLLLQEIIIGSELASEEATKFNNTLGITASIDEMKSAYTAVFSQVIEADFSRIAGYVFSRVVDVNFVEGETYAAVLSDETPKEIVLPLLIRIVDEYIYDQKHRYYVQAIWAKLSPQARTTFLLHIGTIIEKDTPTGKWWPSLILLASLGQEGWNGLSQLVQLKLESMIVKDVLAGHYDIHKVNPVFGGSLGTYANVFWPYFKDIDVLANNLVSLLWQGWYTQNYVASFFFHCVPKIAEASNKRDEFIKSLRSAKKNKARLVVNKLGELPPDWITEIQAKEQDYF